MEIPIIAAAWTGVQSRFPDPWLFCCATALHACMRGVGLLRKKPPKVARWMQGQKMAGR
jgi:hypothetical protein